MFNCFKALNKKFICSICSACLLCCAIGTSQLKADGEPLLLGENTVSVAEVGKNVFLTDTLKDNLYSSHLLPIFSDMPFLYLDDNGNSSLTLSRVLKEGYHQVKYGKDNPSITVYIAAMPYSEDSSVNEIPFDNLNWYVLDQSSWKNLCVKDPGKYVFFYHVKSTDGGIKGTIDNISLSNIKTADTMVNIVSNNFLFNSEFSESESSEFELNSQTTKLGFRYSYVNEDESTTRNNTFRISSDTDAFLDFLGNLINGNYTLLGEVRQYDEGNRRIQEDLTIDNTPYAYCMMTRKLAEKINDGNMIQTIDQAMTNYGISAERPFGRSMLQSNGEALPEFDTDSVSALNFGAKPGPFGFPTKFYTIMNNNSMDVEEIKKLVEDNISDSSLTGTVIISQNPLNLANIFKDPLNLANIFKDPSNLANIFKDLLSGDLANIFKDLLSGALKTEKTEPDILTCLNLITKIAIAKNDTNALAVILNLMSQYHITQENPNGLKPSSYA